MRKVMTVLVLASAVSLIGCNKNKRPAAKTPQPAPSSDTYGGGATPTPVPPPVVYEPPPPAPAPAPEPVTLPSSGARTYTVKKGDTLSKIAREQLGGINQLGPLIRANPGINKDVIKPGQVINLP